MSLPQFAIEKRAVTYFATALIALGGGFSFFQLGWLEDPDFSVKAAVVITPYPGATAEEVELEVTDLLETTLRELSQVREVFSLSRPGSSLIRVDIQPQYWMDDLPQVWDELRNKILDVEHLLPPGAHSPQIADDFGFVYGFLMALTGDGYSHAELEEYAEYLQTQLSVVDGVSRVELWGVQQRVVYVDVSEQQLSEVGLSAATLEAALRQQNMVVDAGSIDAQDQRFRFAPTGAFTSPEDIERLVIADFRNQPAAPRTTSGSQDGPADLLNPVQMALTREGSTMFPSGASDSQPSSAFSPSRTAELITLGNLGTVDVGYATPPSQLMRFSQRDANGNFLSEPAIAIALANAAGGNVVRTGENIAARLRQLEAELPLGIQLHRIAWQSDLVSDSIREFMLSLGLAVAIVLGVLMLPMGWRMGVVIGSALLLTLLATFVVMGVVGIDLHRISLGALVIALGMMVDNAIVVADNFAVRLQQGLERKQAAIEAANVPSWPLLGATIIAALAFYPIFASQEDAGEFCRELFTVVGISLLVSWLISLTLTPLQLVLMIPDPEPGQAGQEAHAGGFYDRFRGLLGAAIRFRLGFLGALVALLVAALAAFQGVSQQFFPDADRAQFMIDYWAPEGTRIQQVAADTKAIEERLLEDPRVVGVSTFVGSGPPRFYLPVDSEYPYESFANLIVNTTSGDVLPEFATDMVAWLDENVDQALVRVRLYGIGPSNPWKFQARFMGPKDADPEVLRALGDAGMALLANHPWVAEARLDWRQRVREVVPEYNDERARWSGVSRADIAAATKRAFDGRSIGLYREGNDLLPILVRHVEDERGNIGALDALQVQPAGSSSTVPLAQVISGVDMRWRHPIIARFQGRRTLTVEAQPVFGVNLPQFLGAVREDFEAIELPIGYELYWDGEYADSNRAQAALVPGIVPAAIIMLFIMILLFNAFRPPLIILLTIPFVFIGIAPALLVTQVPFGFVALLGAMSLAGMMVKNAIVLLDQINIELAAGKSPYTAIVDSALSRTRPVLLAAATTVLGLIPLLPDVFFVSLAVTIMGGLTVGAVLTLVLVPVLYATLHRVPSPART